MQAIAEMGMIKAQGDREQAMSEAEWKQLSNLIENDRRERVSGPIYIRTHMMHIYRYIRTYTYKHTYIYDASSVISFALASLLFSMGVLMKIASTARFSMGTTRGTACTASFSVSTTILTACTARFSTDTTILTVCTARFSMGTTIMTACTVFFLVRCLQPRRQVQRSAYTCVACHTTSMTHEAR